MTCAAAVCKPANAPARRAELPALLPGADVVVVLLPLTPATRGVVDGDFLGRMRRGALLVNAGRRARPAPRPRRPGAAQPGVLRRLPAALVLQDVVQGCSVGRAPPTLADSWSICMHV